MARRATIAAIATPPGRAARAAIRLSGPDALRLTQIVFGRELRGRGVHEGRFDDGVGTQPCLVLWMPGPRSYTREDVAEFHLPGATPLVEAALGRLLAEGAVLAEPGEFTRRAFLNGRIDLTRAEGVLELVSARADDERRAALALLSGGLESRLAEIRERLETLRALAEASLDFDETDTGHVPVSELLALADGARAALEEALSWETQRAPRTGLPRVVLVGAPNAGKSTLFNALVRAERAITSEHAGTTRDALVAEIEIAGRVVLLEDLPGVEAGRDAVEREAQARARTRLDSAELVLWVVDAAATPPTNPREGALFVWSQVDKHDALAQPPAHLGEFVAVSGLDGTGLDDLRAAIAARLTSRVSRSGELSVRHRGALERSLDALGEATALLRLEGPLDLAAQSLRHATDELDAIGGRTTPEDLLDRIFARFCLGK